MSFFQKRVVDSGLAFGQELKHLREQRGYSREELARLTGIHSLLIAAFEEEKLEQLADPLYDQRHVRALVVALEGHVDFFMNKYRELVQARGVGTTHGILPTSKLRKRDFFVTSQVLVFAGFLLVVAAIGGYVFREAWLVSSAPPLTVNSPQDGQTFQAMVVDIRGVTDPSAFVTINGNSAVVDGSGMFAYRMDVPRGLTTLQIEARRRHGPPTVIERHVMIERVPIPVTSTTSTPE